MGVDIPILHRDKTDSRTIGAKGLQKLLFKIKIDNLNLAGLNRSLYCFLNGHIEDCAVLKPARFDDTE